MDDKKFIESDEDYEISSFFFKGWKESSRFKFDGEETNGKQMKSWCEEYLNQKISKLNVHLIDAVNNFCKVQEIDTIEKEIKDIYENWIMTSDWESTFEKWKNTPEFINVLKEYDSSITKETKKEQGGIKLQKFCESLKDKKLSSQTSDEFLYQVTFSCWGKTPEEMETSRSGQKHEHSS